MDRRLFLRNASAFGALAGLSAMTPAWARSALTLGPARVEGLAPTVRRPGLVEYDLTIDRTRLAFGGRRLLPTRSWRCLRRRPTQQGGPRC